VHAPPGGASSFNIFGGGGDAPAPTRRHFSNHQAQASSIGSSISGDGYPSKHQPQQQQQQQPQQHPHHKENYAQAGAVRSNQSYAAARANPSFDNLFGNDPSSVNGGGGGRGRQHAPAAQFEPHQDTFGSQQQHHGMQHLSARAQAQQAEMSAPRGGAVDHANYAEPRYQQQPQQQYHPSSAAATSQTSSGSIGSGFSHQERRNDRDIHSKPSTRVHAPPGGRQSFNIFG
jgi:hypothetical protein